MSAARFISRETKRRVAAVALLAVVLIAVASSDGLHGWFLGRLGQAETVIRAQPLLGMVIFVLFAATSAMLAFVSSALIVPVGVYVWGKGTSMVLLWLGWILGGVCAYSLSRYLGRPLLRSLSSDSRLERYERRISNRTPFGLVLLFQLALPSEVPGYLLGLARYKFWKYVVALALAELPYALATVYLGQSFIERRTYLLVGVGIAVTALSAWALYTLQQKIPDNSK